MKLFRKKAAPSLYDQAGERLAQRIAGSILRVQRRIADELNFRTRHQSPQQILIWLITYCLLTGSFCGYVLLRALLH